MQTKNRFHALSRLFSVRNRRTRRPRRRCLAESLEARRVLSGEGISGLDAFHDDDIHIDASGYEIEILTLLPDAADSASAADGGAEAASGALAGTFSLHSNPSASQTIYLDFDDHTTSGTVWNSVYNGGQDFYTPAYDFDGNSATFSAAEEDRIRRIWERVAEDYVPFDVDVTTEEPDEEALKKSGADDTEWGIRVVIGGSSSDWFGSSAGGVAYVGSFNWSTDTPTYVFEAQLGNGNEKYTAEATSHEIGHTVGLRHDGRTSPPESYYRGHGGGVTGWAPIMGVGYYRNLSQWSKGEYLDANRLEDDLAIITGNNGFGYRADDHGNDAGSASPLGLLLDAADDQGIIERNDDVDVFAFSTGAGAIQLDVDPVVRGPNLDIFVELYDASHTLIDSSNPVDRLDASIGLYVPAGEYFLHISGTGKGDPLGTGYTDYGSLGQYTISGAVMPTVVSEMIVDDGDTGYSDSGVGWSLANGTPFYAGDTHWHTMGTGANKAIWTESDIPPGQYEVLLTWVPSADRASDAPFTLYDGSELEGTFAINQKLHPAGPETGGRPFQSLGRFAIGNTSISLELSDDANGNVIADAVQFVRLENWLDLDVAVERISEAGGTATATVTRAPGNSGDLVVDLSSSDTSEVTVPSTVTILDGSATATFVISAVNDTDEDGTRAAIVTANVPGWAGSEVSIAVTDDEPVTVDNGDAGFSTSGVGWLLANGTPFYAGDTHWRALGTGENKALWTFSDVTAGQYEVLATWWPSADRASNAPFTLYDGAALEGTFEFNQKLQPLGPEIGGRPFQSLGRFTIDNTSVSLELSDDADGNVIADAVRIVPLANWLELDVDVERVSEAGGMATATVIRAPGTIGELIVDLSSSDTSEVTVPATVTILEGEDRATFLISAVDDSDEDGTQAAIVTATAPGWAGSDVGITVIDDEPVTVDNGDAGFSTSGVGWSLANGTPFYAGDTHWHAMGTGANKAWWTFSDVTPGQYEVLVTWWPSADRASNAPFTLYDGTESEGTFEVNQQLQPLGASAGNRPFQSLGRFAIDNTSISLALSDDANGNVIADAVRIVPLANWLELEVDVDQISEAGGTATATVFRAPGTSGDLVVDLSSSDTSEVTVPATVTISDTKDRATFSISAVNDTDEDGTQVAIVTASVLGWAGSEVRIAVTDDEPMTVDNGDAGFSTSGVGWSLANGTPFYAGDTHWHAMGTGENKALWTVSDLTPGQYEVLVTWLPSADRASNAPFALYDGTGLKDTFEVNQQLQPVGPEFGGRPFQSLGRFSIDNTSVSMELSDDANGNVIADAVRFVRVGDSVPLAPEASASYSDESGIRPSLAAVTSQIPRKANNVFSVPIAGERTGRSPEQTVHGNRSRCAVRPTTTAAQRTRLNHSYRSAERTAEKARLHSSPLDPAAVDLVIAEGKNEEILQAS